VRALRNGGGNPGTGRDKSSRLAQQPVVIESGRIDIGYTVIWKYLLRNLSVDLAVNISARARPSIGVNRSHISCTQFSPVPLTSLNWARYNISWCLCCLFKDGESTGYLASSDSPFTVGAKHGAAQMSLTFLIAGLIGLFAGVSGGTGSLFALAILAFVAVLAGALATGWTVGPLWQLLMAQASLCRFPISRASRWLSERRNLSAGIRLLLAGLKMGRARSQQRCGIGRKLKTVSSGGANRRTTARGKPAPHSRRARKRS
jgi:hypothetical protein